MIKDWTDLEHDPEKHGHKALKTTGTVAGCPRCDLLVATDPEGNAEPVAVIPVAEIESIRNSLLSVQAENARLRSALKEIESDEYNDFTPDEIARFALSTPAPELSGALGELVKAAAEVVGWVGIDHLRKNNDNHPIVRLADALAKLKAVAPWLMGE